MPHNSDKPDLSDIYKLDREDQYWTYTTERKYFLFREHRGVHEADPPEKRVSEGQGRQSGTDNCSHTQRSKNEAYSLIYLKNHTNISVPEVYEEFETADGVHCIIMEYIQGTTLRELDESSKPAVIDELQTYIEEMHSLTNSWVGGGSGLICLPRRLVKAGEFDQDNLNPFRAKDLVFCHNDLGQSNPLVDSSTLKILALFEFEYSGFYPVWFGRPFYLRPGPSVALAGEVDDTPQLIE